jgi:protein-L-isoaspartate O-methyltransferase
MRVFYSFVSAIVLLGGSGAVLAQNSPYANSLAPYIPSPQIIVEHMLELATVQPGDTVYDLGSGDGRVLITAVQQFHARAVGIELSPEIARSSSERIARMGLQNHARVIQGDIRDADLSGADVVTMYLLTGSNDLLRPKLEKSLKPGTRVVSYSFKVPGWKYNKIEEDDPFGNGRKHAIYLYVMPPRK